ncbi:hypothetical protein ALQ30_200447 [Pseudomonas syringae pv. persicae]|uniref:Uncharacterized protein n=1 Tax=Pseudomonas syringae pv. persicae TaxID=237306 RepID=A0A3M4A0Q3_9PSED|nr:hypothetical protein ALQ30_200447 [Pseudomonas syringae pv. persicae]
MPYSAMFGGTCCTPMALRVINRVMAILRNAVQTISKKGISDMAPRNRASRSGFAPSMIMAGPPAG